MSASIPIKRQAGVLLHPTSLPSGRLDADAQHWLDFLSAAGASVWQMLPLGVPLAGVSPYQCASAFAINHKIFPKDLPAVKKSDPAFIVWYKRQSYWVDNYALFMVIKEQHECAPWFDWPTPLRRRDPVAIQAFTQQHQIRINKHICQQYQLYAHWQILRGQAAKAGVALFGDMPIFVAHDSADVWAHPGDFLLDEAGQPILVSGVPPDYFSETGQRWGNPQYNWDYMQQSDFGWWRQRLHYHFEFFDLVRIDHFRGLVASWMIPSECPTAVGGSWQEVPGDALLLSIQKDMGAVPLVAEDLGVITPDVEALRMKFNLPGMSVLQFAFDAFEDNPHKPQNVTEDRIYYTGTHDNDTVQGWFASLDAAEQANVMMVLKLTDVTQLNATMINTVLESKAEMAVFPLQDLLGLDSRARMNTPGTTEGNWLWKFKWQDIPTDLALSLRQQLQQTQRI